MRLYSLKKKHFFLITVVFISIIFVSVLTGALGPSVLNRNTHLGSNLVPEGRDLVTGFFKISSNPVLLYQKELWLSVVIHQKSLTGTSTFDNDKRKV